MSDAEKDEIKVTDKRKFDADGNPREDAAEDTEPTQTEAAQESESTAGEVKDQETAGGIGEDSGTTEAGGADVGDMPQKIDFVTFILGLATQAMMGLGLIADPATKEANVNLQMAQHIIDVLALLREKTKGNLEANEITTLDNILYDLRMQYIEISKAHSQD